MSESFLKGRIVLHSGDSREILKTLAENSVDSIVCDPPYALVSIVKRFGGKNAAAVKVPEGGSGAYARASSGFMGRSWDTGETAFAVEFWAECLRVLKPGGHLVAFSGTRTYHRMVVAIEDSGFEVRDQIGWAFGQGFPKSHNAGNGWGTALKPAWEPICLARKPLSEKTIAANVLRWGTGAINVDGCRVGYESEDDMRLETRGVHISTKSYDGLSEDGGAFGGLPAGRTIAAPNKAGRWPANLLHDGSEEVIAAFPIVGDSHPPANAGSIRKNQIFGADNEPRTFHAGFPDSGSAARFFYTAKADADDRLGSKHPTVKPIDLMQWLCRLVTPKNGTVLDPFAGTGTTAEAAYREGFNCVLIERETEYQADIRRRMSLILSGPDERARESIKAKVGEIPFEEGSLFA